MKKFFLILIIVYGPPALFAQELLDKTSIRLVKNFIFVQVRLNNSLEPLNFMFDSGAGVTVLEKSLQQSLGLEVQEETRIGTAAGSLLSATSHGNRLSIGRQSAIDSVSLYLMDLIHLSQFLKTKVDGIIGFDLLNSWVIETNLDAREMRFYDDSDFRYSGTSTAIKLIELESNHFGVPVELMPKGASQPLLLTLKMDTGADNHITLHDHAVKQYQLLDSNRKYKKRTGFSVDSTQTTNFRDKISSLSLGERKWKNVPIVLEVDSLNRTSKRKADGLIGQELLTDFNIIYQLKQGNIFFELRN